LFAGAGETVLKQCVATLISREGAADGVLVIEDDEELAATAAAGLSIGDE
jgi:hypothetical protein